MRARTLYVMAALAAALPGGALAQAPAVDSTVLPPQEIGIIAPGQIRIGALEAGDWTMGDGTWADVWYLMGEAGQRVVIEMWARPRAFDGYLQLLDPGGVRLAEDDDGLGRDRGSRIVFTFREAGRYQIVVNNYDEDPRTGHYTLAVR